MTSMKKISLFLLAMSLTACGIPGGTLPTDHYYRLPAVEAESITAQPTSIIIKPVKVDGLYHERAMLYVDENEPLELKRYHYHYWVETPASLIQKHLQAYFTQAGLAVSQPGISTANIELIPTLLNFERQVSPGKAEAYVRLHIVVQAAAKAEKSFTRSYEARVSAETMSMHDTARAFGKGLDEISKQLVSDLMKIPGI